MSTSTAKPTEEERKMILEATTAFIKETNLQSMKGVQQSIFDSIQALESPNSATSKLYQSTRGNGSPVFCYLKEDVLAAIKSGYDNYVKAYDELTSLPSLTNKKHIDDQLTVIDEGMDVAGLSQEAINKEIKESQEAVAMEIAKTRRLPPSTDPSAATTRRGSFSNGNAPNLNNNLNNNSLETVGENGIVILKKSSTGGIKSSTGGMYRPKKYKKSRKHPK